VSFEENGAFTFVHYSQKGFFIKGKFILPLNGRKQKEGRGRVFFAENGAFTFLYYN
jgi:hypothetical protein